MLLIDNISVSPYQEYCIFSKHLEDMTNYELKDIWIDECEAVVAAFCMIPNNVYHEI